MNYELFKKREINKKRFLYNTYSIGHSELLNKNQYVIHIVVEDPFKSYSLQYIFDTMFIAVDSFLKVNKSVEDGAVFYLLIELRGGIMVIPDLRTYDLILEKKVELMRTRNILLGQIVALLPEKTERSYRLALKALLSIYRRYEKGVDYDLLFNYSEAIQEIKKFSTIPDLELVENLLPST